jgi:hypothetical protein
LRFLFDAVVVGLVDKPNLGEEPVESEHNKCEIEGENAIKTVHF